MTLEEITYKQRSRDEDTKEGVKNTAYLVANLKEGKKKIGFRWP